MGKNKTRAGVVITTLAVIGTMAFAGTASAATPRPEHGSKQLDLTVRLTDTTFDPTNAPVGSSFVSSGPVANRSGTALGTLVDHCVVVGIQDSNPEVLCDVLLELGNMDEIQLTTDATIDPNPNDYPYSFDGIVDGGTGSYAGVSGEGTITAWGPKLFGLTLNLIRLADR